jgi:hypothetical protein
LPCVAPTLPCAYFSTRLALQSRHHSLSFPFLASSRSYTFSPHKPTIPPCVSNLISKLVLEAFPFPISKTYNLSWIFLFCLFACVCVCVCVCVFLFRRVCSSSRLLAAKREEIVFVVFSVCVCVRVLVTSREVSLKRQDG